jgi:hypothetical protein
LVAAPDGSDDVVWIGGPVEVRGNVIGLGEEAVDDGLKVDERLEDTSLGSRRLVS